MRKDISIYVKVNLPGMEYDMEEWQLLDVGNLSLTLDYISNILSDIGSITSSRTFTVKLPRTVHNDKVLDLAVVPQYESRSRYKYLPCRCYVNDIDVTGDAFLYLLDSDAAHYQCCIVFGLLQFYRDWLDAGKTLKELADSGQMIVWNWQSAWIFGNMNGNFSIEDYPPIWYGDDPNVNTYTPANGLGRLMHYGIYNPGFQRSADTVNYANVHPFVTVREIWERIVSENNLNFVMPQQVLLKMEDLAIVLTTIDGNNPTGVPEIHSIETDGTMTGYGQVGNYYYFRPSMTEQDFIENGGSGSFLVKARGDGPVRIAFHMALTGQSVEWAMTRLGNDPTKLRLLVSDVIAGTTSYLTPLYQYDNNAQEWRLYYFGTIDFVGSGHEGETIGGLQFRAPKEFGGIDNFINYFSNMGVTGTGVNHPEQVVSISWYSGTIDYPNKEFRCFPNLPDIKQIDFVKMVCQLFGLFPVANPTYSDQIDFVPFDTLVENIPKAYDWSSRLLESDTDAPEKIALRLGDFARRNIISYKEDEKDNVSEEIRTGSLSVNDLTLDREKELFTFPLAATEGDKIPQWAISVDKTTNPPTYEAEFTECVHRLMHVDTWYNYANKTVTKLSFAGLSVPQIIEAYYQTYQAYIFQPRLITERVRLLETELKSINMNIPVYLSKYGCYFAIKDIKWTVGNEYAECELLML